MTTTATIKAKGCQSTGITEDLAKRCHDQLGRKVLAVVELQADSRSENRDGDEKVQLSILTIEPAPNTMTENHLRELARSFYYERQLEAGEQPTLDAGSEPSVDDVLAAGAKHAPHPYLASTLSTDDNAVCDVCGHHEGAAVHADRSKLNDPFSVDQADDEADEGPEEDDDLHNPDAQHDEEPSYDDAETWDDEGEPVNA